jgi:tRNA dimethylallyltransferase
VDAERTPVRAGAAAPVIVIVGPTASGKSRCAMTLAEHLPVEIVSLDSAQVYRGMDIGTAKPSAAEQAAVPHHLIDLIEPTEHGSAARFASDARSAIASIHARGRIPLLVGGTLLYLKALREGLSNLPSADPVLRLSIEADARQAGWPAMHARLGQLDPLSAARLDPNDAQRIQRALEICLLSGEPMSTLLARARPQTPDTAHWLQLALIPSVRASLHERIASRFDQMLRDGLVDELRTLRARHALTPDLPSMRCVGYRQAWQYLEDQIDHDQLRERGIHATRQLAKRQLTWLRSMQGLCEIDCLREDLEQAVRTIVFSRLSAAPEHAAAAPAARG